MIPEESEFRWCVHSHLWANGTITHCTLPNRHDEEHMDALGRKWPEKNGD